MHYFGDSGTFAHVIVSSVTSFVSGTGNRQRIHKCWSLLSVQKTDKVTRQQSSYRIKSLVGSVEQKLKFFTAISSRFF